MWISRQIIKQETQPAIENAKVTKNINGELEAVYSGVGRDVRIFAPFGYSYCVPRGEELLITQSNGMQSALGVEMSSKGLAEGEIMLRAKSGAYICLRNDGSVDINGLVINAKGEFENA